MGGNANQRKTRKKAKREFAGPVREHLCFFIYRMYQQRMLEIDDRLMDLQEQQVLYKQERLLQDREYNKALVSTRQKTWH
jgi:hypothetical protein